MNLPPSMNEYIKSSVGDSDRKEDTNPDIKLINSSYPF